MRSSPERRNPDLLPQDGVSGGIEALPSRVKRYGTAKTVALDVAEFIASSVPGQDALVRSLSQCGDYLLFRHYYTVDQVKLHAARFCKKHLLCPLCAIRRGAKMLKAYLDRWHAIQASHATLRPFLVTLTVKDGPDLAERFDHLHRAQRELWMRRHRGSVTPLDLVKGAVWSYEVKRGSGSGLWHPHLHMIALADHPPAQAHLSEVWHAITGDSFIVDVRPIVGDPVDGFVEVFKYAVKFSSQEPADTWHAYRILSGRRLIASAGLFRGVEVPSELTDEPLDGLPYIELFYRYIRARGYTLQDKAHDRLSHRGLAV